MGKPPRKHPQITFKTPGNPNLRLYIYFLASLASLASLITTYLLKVVLKMAKMAKIIYRTSLIRMFPTKSEKWG